MSLSVVIVNFKSANLVLQCLQSFLRSTNPFIGEVIVVDNHSGDDSESLICDAFPEVKWIQMGYNAGFARANNEGIRRSKGELLLLLNPDTINVGNAIMDCAARLEASEYVAAGVQLKNADGSPQISGNFFMTGGLNHLMAVPYIGPVIRRIGLMMKLKKTNVPSAVGVVEVDWVNGAFLMVRQSVLSKTGLLDEDFFLYSEEIEWCSRIKKQGKLCIYGDLNVIHLIGKSADAAFGSASFGYTQLADRKGLQLMLSGLLRIRKQFGVGWYLFHLFFFLISSIMGFAFLPFAVAFKPSKMKAIWKRTLGFAGNSFRCCRFTIRILNNRPYFYKVL